MLFRIIKYGAKNILRNKFLSISSVLVLTLLMFFINILVVLYDISFKLIDSINSKLTISLYLEDKYDKNSIEVMDLIDDIKKIRTDKNLIDDIGNIGVIYKTKEIILDEIRFKEPELAKILERTNPLPDTIILSNIKLEEYDKINFVVENKMYLLSKDEANKDHFSNYTAQYNKIKQVIRVLDMLQFGLYIIIAIFLVSIFVIVYSIIGNFIFYFKDEIYITRLVGGSKKIIYGPFVFQGSFYSLISFLLSLIIFVFILKNINNVFGDLYFFIFEYKIFLLEMLIFITLGGFSGFLSSRKYLK